MRVAIITVAGISSRFNRDVPEAQKQLKAIYTTKGIEQTLLYHLLIKCSFADKIVIVGGYKFEDLKTYCEKLPKELQERIVLQYNDHYIDLGSGYSLYIGLSEAFAVGAEEVVFVEGDLDIDDESFARVVQSEKSVLTYTREPIYADKAVVLYKDGKNHYRYAFNSSHGMLHIEEPFSCMLNSGQVWKFTDMRALQQATESFFTETKDATNLKIVQNYLDQGVEIDLISIEHWVNCNTKEDYEKIVDRWEEVR